MTYAQITASELSASQARAAIFDLADDFSWETVAREMISQMSGDQNIILPTGKGENFIIDPISDLLNILTLRLQNCCFTLCGNLINGESTIGGGVVTHWVRLVN